MNGLIKKIRNTIGFVILGFSSFAQQPSNIDSLLKLLPAAREDSNKVRILHALGEQYSVHDVNTAEQYYKQAGSLSKKIGYTAGFFRHCAGLSNAWAVQGLFDSSLAINLEAVAFARKLNSPTHLANSLYNSSLFCLRLGQYENAVSYIEESKALFQQLGIKERDGHIYNLLQYIETEMHQYRKGISNGLKAVEILQTGTDQETLCYSYNNLGLNYVYVQSYDSAKYYLRKAYEISLRNDLPTVQTTYHLNQGLIGMRLQQPDSLKLYAEKALQLARQNNMHEYEMLALWGLSSYYLTKKDYPHARLFADSALYLTQRYSLRKQKVKVYPTLSNYYFATQDTKLGNYYALQDELLKDSILNESIAKNTIDIEKKYEAERKDQQIKLQQTQLEEKSTLNYFLVVSAVALLVISLLSYRNYRSRQKLQQAKIEDLEKEKQLNATEAVLKGEEQERARLARELHDGLGGMLSGIKHSFNNMKETMALPPDNVRTFERNMDMLDTSIREMRRLAHNMMPEILLKYGLSAALKEFCSDIGRSGIIQIAFQPMGLDKLKLDQTTSLAVYRIVQELVHNTIKHASAKSILVQAHVSSQDHLLSVTVEDDGKGFEPGALNDKSGIGWINIQNRIDFLKGKVDIGSAPGRGTSVLVEIGIST